MRLYTHPYLESTRVEHDLSAAAAGDPFGDRVHTALAALWCFLLAWPTSVVEIASIPLLVFFALRTPKIWRTWGSFAVQPLTLAIAAWILWQAVTLFWSPDTARGLQDLGSCRWIWALWVLWPVMAHRPLLIAALAAGFLCGNLSQLGHLLGRELGLDWLTWPRLENRNSGWWDPVVGGSLLTGVLGLHLPAALMGAGRQRIFGLAGSAITLLAIFATGTRGAWLAAAGLLVVVGVVAVVRLARGHGSGGMGRTTATVLIALAIVVSGGAVVLQGTIIERYRQGRAEVAAALNENNYNTDTGKRLLMWRVAIEAARRHPIAGVGAGGYRAWGEAYLERTDTDAQLPEGAIHAHAHSAPLHILATTGAIGLLLSGLVIGLALYGGLAGLSPADLGSYASGPAFGVIGLMLAGVFDAVHLNAQTGAMLATLMALCLLSRPRARRVSDSIRSAA